MNDIYLIVVLLILFLATIVEHLHQSAFNHLKIYVELGYFDQFFQRVIDQPFTCPKCTTLFVDVPAGVCDTYTGTRDCEMSSISF